jgi:hypothetical protein
MMMKQSRAVVFMSDAAFSSEEPQDRRPALPAPSGERRALALVPVPAPADEDERSGEHAEFAEAPASKASAPRDWSRWRGAASLAAVVLIGCAAAAAQVHATRVASAERAETHALARRLDAIAASLQSLDANRPDLAGVKKSLADIKSSAASAHELGGAVAQLTARVDRLEKDQGSRLDKLDKDSAQQLASVAQRLEKLEAKPALAPAPKPEPAKAAPAVSMETTGSIEKPKAMLRNFYLSEIHNGYAMIDSPQGEFAVAPGDTVPGGGRVLRIERHGNAWVVITTLGQIASTDD